MNPHSLPSTSESSPDHGSLKSYTIGFVLSVSLTLLAYFLVVDHNLTGTGLVFGIVTLALIQLVVQLFFFLHIGSERSPRWNLIALLFTLLITLILVGGTLWIMYNLNYSANSQEMSNFLLQDEGIPR